MLDVVNGKVRARAWPRKRKGQKSPEQQLQNDKFAQAQKAYKYGAPACLNFCEAATKNTPLLPRDFWTMVIFQRLGVVVMGNGRTLYPMVAKQQVEAGLDTITQTEGETLVRTANGWTGIPAAQGGGVEFIASQTITTPVANVDFLDLGGWTFLFIVCENLVASSAGNRRVQVSDTNGVTWKTASGDYQTFSSTTTKSAQNGIITTTGTNTAARSPYIILGPNTPEGSPFYFVAGSLVTGVVDGLPAEFDAIRINNTAGNLNSGTISLFGMR